MTLLWYELACQNYLLFADLLRSSVDLFRFDLLKDLQIALPVGTKEEKQLWEQMNNQIGYDRRGSILYRHPQ